MIVNYFVVAWRSIKKQRVYSALNIVGLTLGLAVCWLLIRYVVYERNYDRLLSKRPDVYRVESLFTKPGGQKEHWATSSNGYAVAMKAAFPQIVDFTRIAWRGSERIVRYQDRKFRETHVCLVDANFFQFFGYPMLQGDAQTCLQEPNTIVISQSTARNYFGKGKAVGKILEVSTGATPFNCRVTGVFADVPPTSTMQFAMLLSGSTLPPEAWTFWYQHETYTFVQLAPHTSPSQVEERFPALAEHYKTAPIMKEARWGVKLVPVDKIHLNAATPNEIEAKGNRTAVNFLGAIALLILLISWINYTNLTAVQVTFRAKEAGVRRMVGASGGGLLTQFVIESLLIHTVALLLATLVVFVVTLCLPSSWVWPVATLSWPVWLGFLTLWLLGIMLTSLYPLTLLLGVSPASVLKGKLATTSRRYRLRQALVTAQFTVSIMLIIGTLTIYQQTNYMTSQHPGVITDQIVVLKAPVNTPDRLHKLAAFKQRLKTHPGVEEVTSSGAIPGKEVGQVLANRRFGSPTTADRFYEMLTVDYDFVRTYGLRLLAGRTFESSRPADSTGLVLNESAVRQFGFSSAQEAVGQHISLESTPNRASEVIGVIADYHQRSLHQPYTPIILFMDPAYRWIPIDYYSIKVHSTGMNRLLGQLKSDWDDFFPESSMDYFFLDQLYGQQYQQDRQDEMLFTGFSLLALLIACLGLFGLASFSAKQRTKEIGVRKVLGASTLNLIALLSKEFLALVAVAIVLACPIAWYLMQAWLSHFAYRITMAWWFFAMAGLLATLIALLTVSFQGAKVALLNPVKSLQNQ